MQLINFFLTVFVAYFGVVLGLILAYTAKEEIMPGRKYFLLMQKILLILICILIIFFLIYSNQLIALFVIIFLLILYFLKINNLLATYSLFSIFTYLSIKNQIGLIILTSLIFLYGIPTGTLLVDFKDAKRTILNILIPFVYVIFSLVLYIIGNYL